MSGNPTATTGSCACGSVRYTVTGPPKLQYLCHCNKCKRFCGSAFNANCFFEKTQFHLERGEEVLKQYRDEGTSSGIPLVRNFCGNCGGSVFITTARAPTTVTVIGGTLDNFSSFKPTVEGWTTMKMPWVGVIEGSECHAEIMSLKPT